LGSAQRTPFLVHATPASAKTALRLELRALRRSRTRETPQAAELAAERLPADFLGRFAVVSGYRAMPGELDPWPVMQNLAAAGAALVLPVVVERGTPLIFRRYFAGQALVPDAAGIIAPGPESEALEPDLVIAPLLAFDTAGGRMGQGGGFYDRTLLALRGRGPVFVLGLAHAWQEVARVPAEPHDQKLDAILTEKGYRLARKDF
jgi:5-formyltetrahydrofolate cyclo-ligase